MLSKREAHTLLSEISNSKFSKERRLRFKVKNNQLSLRQFNTEMANVSNNYELACMYITKCIGKVN